MSFCDINGLLKDEEGGVYKFAKVAGEYRFIKVCFSETHLDLVGESEFPKVEAAGEIFVFPSTWRVSSRSSSMLSGRGVENAYMTEETERELEGLLVGKQFKRPY